MKKLLSDDKGSRSIAISGKVVEVNHCWKVDKDSPRYQLKFTYDFAALSDGEVLRLAALWVNKDFQNRMRTERWTEKELNHQEQSVIDVKEMYSERRRNGVDPLKRAQNALDKLSPEELEFLLKQVKGE